MGGNLDESLLSTASTLIDSCSTSFNTSFEDAIEQADMSKDTHKAETFLCRGRIKNLPTGRTNSKKGNLKVASPTTTAISLEMNESATDMSERTAASKLDRLRVKTRLLRKQGAKKIEDSRESLRKNRMISIESLPPPHPPPYPPPSLHNKARTARMKSEHFEPSSDMKDEPDANFSDFLRRSNSVIDRLSTEIAMAGSIINNSSIDCDTTFNDTTANKTNDFTSNLCAQNHYSTIGKDEKSINNDDDSIHNISIGEDWDQTTISATPPGSPSYTPPESPKCSTKEPPLRSMFRSGLPPPEVLVKRISSGAPPQAASRRDADGSFSGTESSSFVPTAIVDRHLRQRPPSMSSLRGDCASMYNTNQKCEKLAMENDCLKRQLELLESRHRDSQKKLMVKLHRKGDEEVQEEQYPETKVPLTSKTSDCNIYSNDRKKKKRSHCLRTVMILLFAPFLISSTLWLYRSVRIASLSSTNGSSATDGIDLPLLLREGDRRHSVFGETVLPDNSSDTNNGEDCMIDDFDNLLILHEPPPKDRKFDSAKNDETSSGKKAGRFKRFVSRMTFGHQNNPMGVWLEKHRQITTKKHHSEL